MTTKTAKHTPGPWMAYNAHNGRTFQSWRIRSDNGSQPCGICKLDESLTGDQEVANASLISAAPDLLAACKEAAEYLDLIKQNYPDLPGLIRGLTNARAAIARAEGN